MRYLVLNILRKKWVMKRPRAKMTMAITTIHGLVGVLLVSGEDEGVCSSNLEYILHTCMWSLASLCFFFGPNVSTGATHSEQNHDIIHLVAKKCLISCSA